MYLRKTEGPKCNTCIYRAAVFAPYVCDYAYLTGETRKAQLPEECSYYKKGKRMELPKSNISLNGSEQKKKSRAGKKTKYDYEKGRSLYEKGKNDGEISRVLGCRPADVRNWRVRERLPANATAGAPCKTGGE